MQGRQISKDRESGKDEGMNYTTQNGTVYTFDWSSKHQSFSIRFDCKPEQAVIDRIKSAGGRWYGRLSCWIIAGYRYAAEDIPMIINGEENAGCHGQMVRDDEIAYGGYKNASYQFDY